jgi:hypothetical protein
MKKCNKFMKCAKHPKGICEDWSPLLLIVPLRLGLNEFNMDYKESIKVFEKRRILNFNLKLSYK